MRKLSLILVLTLVALMATAGLALANHTDNGQLPIDDASHNGAALAQQGDAITKLTYANRTSSGGCQACHGWDNVDTNARAATGKSGPHGGYTATSGKCITCHTIHTGSYGSTTRVAKNTKLLPGNTVTAVCNYCHDLTGTPDAPYSTRYLGLGTVGVKSGHYVEGATVGAGILANFSYDPSVTTNTTTRNLNMPGMEDGPTQNALGQAIALGDVIPGGDATTGGTVPVDATVFDQADFSNSIGVGADGTKFFTCDSCHTPHGIASNMVAGYYGETERTSSKTSRLLKRWTMVGNSEVTSYGSAWCLSCHKGRDAMGAAGTYNHPVNENGAGYLTAATITAAAGDAHVTNGFASNTTTGFDITNDRDVAKTNAWYAMTEIDPISLTARNVGNDVYGVEKDGYIDIDYFRAQGGPSCQQCHASARDVEASFMDDDKINAVNDAAYTGNPFTTFPHVSRNKALLVEGGDDLCTNCHSTDLP